jgi:hypothetical protein
LEKSDGAGVAGPADDLEGFRPDDFRVFMLEAGDFGFRAMQISIRNKSPIEDHFCC